MWHVDRSQRGRSAGRPDETRLHRQTQRVAQGERDDPQRHPDSALINESRPPRVTPSAPLPSALCPSSLPSALPSLTAVHCPRAGLSSRGRSSQLPVGRPERPVSTRAPPSLTGSPASGCGGTFSRGVRPEVLDGSAEHGGRTGTDRHPARPCTDRGRSSRSRATSRVNCARRFVNAGREMLAQHPGAPRRGQRALLACRPK